MKYIAMIMLDRNSKDARDYEAGMPPDAKFDAAIGAYMEVQTKLGILLDGVGLMPLAKGARIRAAGGKLIVTDGPYIESKEIIGGYAILRTDSKEEALEVGKAFMQIHLDALGPDYEGTLELREMFDPGNCGPGKGTN